MNDLLEKLEAAVAETERIALAVLGGTRVESWRARGNEVIYPVDPLKDDPDDFGLLTVARAETPEEAAHIAHNDPKRILRRVARDRKLLELAKVLREDYQDNAADHLIRLLAEDYEIEVES